MSFFENTRKPAGFGGRLMVAAMNAGHRALAAWGFRFIDVPENAAALDCGCGGGANIRALLKKCPRGRVSGIDYSAVSVEKSRRVNRKAIETGRCEALQASVESLPFADGSFDIATAFETVYFWPELENSFRELRRVLHRGGVFMICNECGGDGRGENWEKVVSGMTVYSGEQLRDMLERAGFSGVRLHTNSRGWLCVTAKNE